LSISISVHNSEKIKCICINIRIDIILFIDVSTNMYIFMQEFLVELISRGAEVSLPASSGSTALHFAAINNRRGIIEILLRSGADPSYPNVEGLLASEFCSDIEIRELLSRNPLLSTYGMPPINQTRQNLRLHIEEGSNEENKIPTDLNLRFENLNIDSNDNSNNSLNQSNDNNNTEEMNMNSDTYESDDTEIQLLHEAVFVAATETTIAMQRLENNNNRYEVVKLCQVFDEKKLRRWLIFDPTLATCRTNFDKLAPDGYTPLHVAAKFGNIPALKVLFEVEGVSAWIRDLQGRTPLHIAAGKGKEECCSYLRKKMASEPGKFDPVGVNAPIDLGGYTPAGYAANCTSGKTPSQLKNVLFEKGDKSVLPLTPVRLRAGQSPRRPTTGKKNTLEEGVEGEDLVFAFSVAQGWKPEMEDRVVIGFPIAGTSGWSLFGVCDGHGGDFCASYLAEHLPRIAAHAVYTVGNLIDDSNTTPEMLEEVLNLTCKLAEESLRDHTRLKMDRKIDKITKEVKIDCKDSSGSTAVLCIISKKYLVVGNVGDSRALLAQINHRYMKPTDVSESRLNSPPAGGGSSLAACNGVLIATALSTDHKFNIVSERERAELAGAIVEVVTFENEIDAENREQIFEVSSRMYKNGSTKLRMSRSFGDFYLKQNTDIGHDKQAVIAVPTVVKHMRSSNDVFVLLACDGIYDVMENQDIVDLLSSHLGYTDAWGPAGGPTTDRCARACDALLEECLNRGAYDNLSALIVMCKGPQGVTEGTWGGSTGLQGGMGGSEGPSVGPMHSPAATMPSTPSSGAGTRTPIDRTLTRVFSTGNRESSPLNTVDEDDKDDEDTNAHVNRHLEFNREAI
jgi:serine/threonine protein phosphatase PrpC/ankyrin repeat protein